MKTFRFCIPLQVRSKEFGMNELYSQSKHWATRKRQAQQVHMLVKSQIRKADRNAKIFEKPVVVTIWYNTRLDIDNHGYLAKLIIDGMKGILIQDDDRKHVKGIRQYFHSNDKGKVFVEIEEFKEGSMMERYKVQKPTYCMECKYFKHTGKSNDGKKYELGGECHNEERAELTHGKIGDYRNGGCDVCTLYEKADDGREIPEWMK